MSDQQPRRVIPPAAAAGTSPAAAKPATSRPRPSPAKDFPPLAMMFVGFFFSAGGGAMLLLDPIGIRALGIVVAVIGQVLILTGVVAQGVYIGTSKARDRGLL